MRRRKKTFSEGLSRWQEGQRDVASSLGKLLLLSGATVLYRVIPVITFNSRVYP